MASICTRERTQRIVKHYVTWTVIADSSRAQILTRREDPSGLDIVTAFQSPERGQRDRD